MVTKPSILYNKRSKPLTCFGHTCNNSIYPSSVNHIPKDGYRCRRNMQVAYCVRNIRYFSTCMCIYWFRYRIYRSRNFPSKFGACPPEHTACQHRRRKPSTSTFSESWMSYWVNPEKHAFLVFVCPSRQIPNQQRQILQFYVLPKDYIFNIIDHL